MAFQTGTQVNAGLGRTDYTPFLQGALQGAQAQARGAENIAAGLAGLGQQVASGMREQYKEAKELKKEERGYKDTIASGMKIIEVLSKTPDIPDSVKKLLPEFTQNLGNPNVSLSEQAANANMLTNIFGSVLNTGLKTTMENSANNAAARYANAIVESQGRPFSMINEVSPTDKFRGEQMAANLANIKSETAKNLAPKTPNLSFQEQQLAARYQDFIGKNNRQPTPAEQVKMMQEVASSALPQPPVGESEFSKISAQNLAKRADDAILQGNKAQISLENTSNLKTAIASGAEQGPGSEVKIALMNAANVFLSPENKFDTTSSNISKLSFNELTLSTAEKIMKQGSITNSEREQAKDTSARINTEKDAALFYISFKEASDKRKMMIAEKVNALQSEGVEDRKEYAKALDIKNYPPLDDPIYGDYGVKINALNAAAEKARRATGKGKK